VREWQRIRLHCAYAQYERFHKIVLEQGAAVEDIAFAADVALDLLIPAPQTEAFCAHMIDVSAGTIVLEQLGVQEIPVSDK